jgi:putative spermidine/putrescine transport system substrate-binding protein
MRRIGALAAIAIGLGVSTAAAQEKQITVAWYGGNWGDAFKACVADPFTKATGIKVNGEIGTSTVTLGKLKAQKDAPTIDAAWMDGGISEVAAADGVVENLDPARIKNLANVDAGAIYKDAGINFAVGTGYYAVGILYNKSKVKEAPTSWNDLWKPEFKDVATLPSPSNSSGVPLFLFLHKMWGHPDGDFAPTLAKIKALSAGLFFDSSGAASNAFQTGEIIVGAHFNAAAWDLIDKGLPLAFVVPKEGVWATDARLHLVKGSKNREAAEQFINQALTKEAAACLAEKLFLGPSVKDVTLTPAVAAKLPWGEKGSVKDLKLSNWAEVNGQRAKIVDAWNREIAKK